jgi:hypothetical protein
MLSYLKPFLNNQSKVQHLPKSESQTKDLHLFRSLPELLGAHDGRHSEEHGRIS